jgi:hypothetical protein
VGGVKIEPGQGPRPVSGQPSADGVQSRGQGPAARAGDDGAAVVSPHLAALNRVVEAARQAPDTRPEMVALARKAPSPSLNDLVDALLRPRG